MFRGRSRASGKQKKAASLGQINEEGSQVLNCVYGGGYVVADIRYIPSSAHKVQCLFKKKKSAVSGGI